ncbi:Rieske [2Fe-2S] iron-sulfur domain-containing protein [Thelonectria olida]|uniref:Choline monooxygenase, chloroplastic n=1 Tax=Thelonectria olida TaxID=1576542 RepID=A0A9P8VY78_9HYPO|nr:Rieske [2Fe-2S] iron-sulfur domain-containing protein [Thelonectria olida]
MSGWFGFGKESESEKQDDGPKTIRALPASWYRSDAMYELERRAIFSKKWLLVSHNRRFVEAGDYVQITEAGFTFFLIKDRKGQIHAHHNVCRHRAYPVVEKECGKASILACKYHGWSYGFDGKLAKAPKYQEIPSFDRSANSLFKVHVHEDNLGFIWINLDSNEHPTIPWEKDFVDVDLQPRLKNFDTSQYNFDHQWGMTGDYNWKTLADNYNECYHCPTGHPAVNGITDLSKYWVETTGGHIQHFNVDKPGTEGMGIYSTFYYPNSCMTISPRWNATDEDFNGISDFFKQVLKEDKDLCNAAQKNLNAGIFTNGELHPRVEKGPLFFQELTRELVMSHRKEEEAVGKDIWPATPKQLVTDKNQEEIDFCNGLECNNGQGIPELAW